MGTVSCLCQETESNTGGDNSADKYYETFNSQETATLTDKKETQSQEKREILFIHIWYR